MIRQSPEVPVAVELADVSKHIMTTEFTFKDPEYQGAWCWQSPDGYAPNLKVFVAESDLTMRKNGGILIKFSSLVIVEPSSEYWLNVPTRTASQIEDDPFVLDFRDAFRQYQHGRTELALPS